MKDTERFNVSPLNSKPTQERTSFPDFLALLLYSTETTGSSGGLLKEYRSSLKGSMQNAFPFAVSFSSDVGSVNNYASKAMKRFLAIFERTRFPELSRNYLEKDFFIYQFSDTALSEESADFSDNMYFLYHDGYKIPNFEFAIIKLYNSRKAFILIAKEFFGGSADQAIDIVTKKKYRLANSNNAHYKRLSISDRGMVELSNNGEAVHVGKEFDTLEAKVFNFNTQESNLSDNIEYLYYQEGSRPRMIRNSKRHFRENIKDIFPKKINNNNISYNKLIRPQSINADNDSDYFRKLTLNSYDHYMGNAGAIDKTEIGLRLESDILLTENISISTRQREENCLSFFDIRFPATVDITALVTAVSIKDFIVYGGDPETKKLFRLIPYIDYDFKIDAQFKRHIVFTSSSHRKVGSIVRYIEVYPYYTNREEIRLFFYDKWKGNFSGSTRSGQIPIWDILKRRNFTPYKIATENAYINLFCNGVRIKRGDGGDYQISGNQMYYEIDHSNRKIELVMPKASAQLSLEDDFQLYGGGIIELAISFDNDEKGIAKDEDDPNVKEDISSTVTYLLNSKEDIFYKKDLDRTIITNDAIEIYGDPSNYGFSREVAENNNLIIFNQTEDYFDNIGNNELAIRKYKDENLERDVLYLGSKQTTSAELSVLDGYLSGDFQGEMLDHESAITFAMHEEELRKLKEIFLSVFISAEETKSGFEKMTFDEIEEKEAKDMLSPFTFAVIEFDEDPGRIDCLRYSNDGVKAVEIDYAITPKEVNGKYYYILIPNYAIENGEEIKENISRKIVTRSQNGITNGQIYYFE